MNVEMLFSVCIGLGLSAACGFRVFVPLFGLSLAAHAGHLQLASDFQWLASTPALVALGIATATEIAGYYVPWLDHLLDTLATPAAVVAGVMATAAVTSDMSPLLRWSLAVIAGGGIAGGVQLTTVASRAASTLLTGGMGNPLVATAELGGSIFATGVSLFMPLVGIFAIGGLVWWGATRLARAQDPGVAATTPAPGREN